MAAAVTRYRSQGRGARAGLLSTGALVAGLAAGMVMIAPDARAEQGLEGGDASGGNALALGNASRARGENTTAVGYSAVTSAPGQPGFESFDNASAFGVFAKGLGSNASAFGHNSNAIGANTTAIGEGTYASGAATSAFGQNAQAIGTRSTALGQSANANGDYATALGQDARAHGDETTAVGVSAWATQTQATAVGSGAQAAGNSSSAFGQNARASNGFSTAIGHDSWAFAGASTAIGQGAQAYADFSTAIGQGAVADAIRSVALGAGSVANQANTVSVGDVGAERKVVNVAAGAVSATSTDAINGSQLYSALIGAGGVVDPDGVRYNDGTHTQVTLNPGGAAAGLHNIADGTVAAGSKDAVNGGQLAAVRDIAVQYDDAGHSGVTLNMGGTAIGIHNVAAGVAGTDAVNLDQLNTAIAGLGGGGGSDPNAVRYDDASHTSVSLNSGGASARLRNVAAGDVNAASTDAVNGSQLHTANQRVAGAFGGGAGLDAGGQLTAPSYAIQGSTYNNIGGALAALDGQVSSNTGAIASLDGRVSGLEAAITGYGQEIGTLRRESRQGIAAAMAMTTAPMPSAPGRTSWATNAATFRGEWAGGLSFAHRLNTAMPLAITAGYAYGGGHSHGARIGMAGEF